MSIVNERCLALLEKYTNPLNDIEIKNNENYDTFRWNIPNIFLIHNRSYTLYSTLQKKLTLIVSADGTFFLLRRNYAYQEKNTCHEINEMHSMSELKVLA